ncbi:MAG TPA: DDE-type integrase/transposase/recombinase, partial [Edaphobacter sp.]|nr:DDE-type integrase/transposase/recombinase [Edaphobacter sp.]
GNLVDSMLSATRDMMAAQRFFRKTLSVADTPQQVTTDGLLKAEIAPTFDQSRIGSSFIGPLTAPSSFTATALRPFVHHSEKHGPSRPTERTRSKTLGRPAAAREKSISGSLTVLSGVREFCFYIAIYRIAMY